MNRIARNLVMVAAGFVLFLGIATVFTLYSAPYKFALEYIRANETIREQLGSIRTVRAAFFRENKFSYGSSSGFAEFSINVVGEKGRGVVHLNLYEAGGQWHVKDSELILPEGETIEVKPEFERAP